MGFGAGAKKVSRSGGRSDSPLWPPREQVERTRRKTWSRARFEVFVLCRVGPDSVDEPLKGALIPIVALTRGFPLAPFGWSGTRRPFP
jgi:hypothetical protein